MTVPPFRALFALGTLILPAVAPLAAQTGSAVVELPTGTSPAPLLVTSGSDGASTDTLESISSASTPRAVETLEREAAQLPSVKLRQISDLQGEPLNLSVRDVVLATLGQNLSVKVVEQDREIAGYSVWEQFGVFDPNLSLEARQQRVDQETSVVNPSTNKPVVSYTDTTTVESRLSQRTPLGTLVEVFGRDSRATDRNFFNPNGVGQINAAYGTEAGISVTQPLLKNAGPLVNYAQIRIAKHRLGQSNEAYRQELINRLSDVIRAYWELDFALRNAEVQYQALQSARELERVNAARVEVGTLPRLSLFQAQAQVAERESLLVAAEEVILEAQDRLFELMNWEDSQRATEWNRPILPTDLPTTFYDVELNDSRLTDLAMEKRPDLKSARLGLDIAEIDRKVSRRQLLPELDAFGTYSAVGLGDDRGDAYSDLDSGEFINYTVGARLSYPLFNRAARAQYRQALSRYDQQAIRIEQTELQVVRDVRSSTRNIRTALRQAEATTRQVKADIEKLDAEIKRRQVGDRTTFDVLDFQDDLALSRANQARAFADYQISLVDLAQSLGILLDVQGIVVEDQQSPQGWSYSFQTVEGSVNDTGAKSLDDMLTILPVKQEATQ
ncbi:MAG: TolC family protein [Candidatus Sumerlaeia bacterium]|nr:TolC family protein [Candidatus Sumerlaeia bacterium]